MVKIKTVPMIFVYPVYYTSSLALAKGIHEPGYMSRHTIATLVSASLLRLC